MVDKNVEEFARELANRFVSVHGDIVSLDEVIDDLLDKDDKRKRKLAKG